MALALARVGIALALVLVIAGCGGRSFRSCAAYIMVLGPTTLTITCPPHGFQGTETMPDDTTTLKDQP
jgi:hypothetical protein